MITAIPGDGSEWEVDARSIITFDGEIGMLKELTISVSIKLCEAPVSIRELNI